MSFGYVYVLVNESLPFIKIGRTARNPKERADELATTGVPTPFRVAYQLYVDNHEDLERMVHARLSNSRVRDNREFFNVDLTTAVGVIEECANPTERCGTVGSDISPVAYVRTLGEERYSAEVAREEVRQCEAAIAKEYVGAVFIVLSKLEGHYETDGFEICYAISSDGLSIYRRMRLPEWREETFSHFDDDTDYAILAVHLDSETPIVLIETDEFQFADRPSRESAAKALIDAEMWLSDSETVERVSSAGLFKTMCDECVDVSRSRGVHPSDVADAVIDGAVRDMRIPPATAKAWKQLIFRRGGEIWQPTYSWEPRVGDMWK